jgi:hypothetical protein
MEVRIYAYSLSSKLRNGFRRMLEWRFSTTYFVVGIIFAFLSVQHNSCFTRNSNQSLSYGSEMLHSLRRWQNVRAYAIRNNNFHLKKFLSVINIATNIMENILTALFNEV